ncbi:septum formation protein Maf [Roseovarius spongiae]|uniref:Nucleoside triphosphate pyrophosphatase n=1 Tax=Roseovarius spongiae TaxID=2320272 RepID=A0A3A8B7Y2_9RHOB|nr:Maf family protein [Roseovarius spongiae]RKF13376.1 septum formation protein Maf [Roseovarius spongiae]
MSARILLASQSEIRLTLLRNAGVPVTAIPARIDEQSIKAALSAEGASPRDIADALAEAKAQKQSARMPEALVIGCDQVLALDGVIHSKPSTSDDAVAQLRNLRGKTHHLFSAVVVCEGGQPVWRHIGHVRLSMRELSDAWLDGYVARNWDSIRHSVGGYKLEEEGARLFSRIEGDYFTVLGLPLLDLLSYLSTRGELET